MEAAIRDAVGAEAAEFVGASGLATALLGDSIATNLFMVGYSWQKGLIPLDATSILSAIELNGAAVEANKRAFDWGRRAAHDLESVHRVAKPAGELPKTRLSATLDEIVTRRVEYLTAYQDAAYADRYERLVARVKDAEATRAKGMSGLADAVARYYFKLLAYKDEYEVARLYTDGEFLKRLNEQFEGDFKLTFHLAPPILERKNPASGEAVKRTFGPWVLWAFKVLARMKGLRGTAFDVFGHSAERKQERTLIRVYEETVEEMLDRLTPQTHALAVELASIPEHIRGFGPVKQRHLKDAQKKQAELIIALRTPAGLKSIKVAA
jgi:indolepyruvate ferredoxin oxidoreductase